MISWPDLLLAVFCLALLAGALVLSAMLERSSPIRLRHWAQEAGESLRRLYESPRRFEGFRFLLSTVAKVLPLALFLSVMRLLEGLRGQGRAVDALWGALAVAAAVAGTELINRRLVRHDPERVLRKLTRIYRVLLVVSWPVLVALSSLVPERTFALPEEGEDDEASDEEIEAFIDVGTREGILEPDEREMVRSVVDFGDTLVKSVMTPRIDMVCSPVESDLEALSEVFLESNHSRIPLFEGSIDQIVGVLHLRDLMRALLTQPERTARELANPVWFVPETKPLDEVLAELQERHQQMALVFDEYGGTAGLVTVEDLLEEIVGEIVDEDDDPPPQAEELEDGWWRLDGRTPVWEIEKVLGLRLEDQPYETIGGMILSSFGYVPEEGEETEAHGLVLTVEKVEERRIQAVRVRLLAADPAEVAEDA